MTENGRSHTNYIAAFTLVFLSFFDIQSSLHKHGSLTVGSSLTATDGSSLWLSPSGDFAFGFRKIPNNNDLFLLSIWYDKIPDKTVVWFARMNESSPPVQKNSKLQLTSNRGLVLTDPQGQEIWSSESFVGVVSKGVISDQGNFLLQDRSSKTLWQSFDYPTDTLLPSQSLRPGMNLVSHRSATNFTRGRFLLGMQTDGNLGGYTINLPSEYLNSAYYASKTVTGSNASLAVKELMFNNTGELYLQRANGERVVLFNRVEGSLPSPSDNYFRFKLEFDGVLGLFYHSKNGTGSWTTLGLKPDNICTAMNVDSGAAVCGYNSICKLKEDENRPYCECPKGFSLADPDDSYGNCQPNFFQGCAEDKLVKRSGVGSDSIYDIEELINTDWVTRGYMQMKPVTRDSCIQSCIEDCMCSAVVSKSDGTCSMKRLPLSSGRFDTALNSTAFLKVRKPKYSFALPNRNVRGHQRGLILAGSVLLGTSVFFNFLLLGFFFNYRKKRSPLTADQNATEMKLHFFSYKELEKATNGFNEELGRGSFGIVYKGTLLGSDSGIPVAVKKLDFVRREPEKEFQNEVSVIGQTHHKNLVRLFGLCNDNKNRMIVYEFMNNGTLASYVFGDVKPNWIQRTEIVLGVAKGILYLHEECTNQIIHCDIKPQNILLDEYYNAKISDFGLAKLLMMDQSQTHTVIRGTKGYLAPEWFRNAPVSTKVDVYSFGVVLLEVICCRKSVEDENYNEEKRILTDWAYDCFKEKAFELLVDREAEALEDREKLERFTKVSMWCIQESPSMRPMMRQVVQMLEGVIEVLVPPCPCPYSLSITY